ncbi:hypothetical protein ACFQ22_13655 [Lentilactobacillus raoultii]|uniref:Uncharacterized protein n=1 Tax=Lentilactobacillus raoultii TaxID=1987503 RepID=A0ABW3PMN1_9LACO|nr:hypothetical protein [Lentilactobacillus raoultii]
MKNQTYNFNVLLPALLIIGTLGSALTFFGNGSKPLSVIVLIAIIIFVSLIWLGYGIYQIRKETIKREKNHKGSRSK